MAQVHKFDIPKYSRRHEFILQGEIEQEPWIAANLKNKRFAFLMNNSVYLHCDSCNRVVKEQKLFCLSEGQSSKNGYLHNFLYRLGFNDSAQKIFITKIPPRSLSPIKEDIITLVLETDGLTVLLRVQQQNSPAITPEMVEAIFNNSDPNGGHSKKRITNQCLPTAS